MVLIGERRSRDVSLFLSNGNVLPKHLDAAAGVNLQTNDTLAEFLRRVAEVHDCRAVELSDDMAAVRGNLEVVPFTGLQRFFPGFAGHGHPTASAAFIQAARVLACAWVDFDLQAFNVRAVLRIDTGDSGSEKDAAVARGFGLEFQPEIEIAVSLFGGEVTVLVRPAFAEDGATFHD